MAEKPDRIEDETRGPDRRLAFTTLTALGVVYGDIGTSPLYALRECFHGPAAIEVTRANVLGVVSLIFWSLVLVISIKYLWLVMRADNNGEGGILALMALAMRTRAKSNGRMVLTLLGLFGAGLLFGDGMITPAISVLSAVEGLHVATPAFDPYVAPITIGVLFVLFAVQHRGTTGIGSVFGPLMVAWFTTLAVMGMAQIVRRPDVLWAVSPHHALAFLMHNQWHGFVILGVVFLVVTGGEALYADMGHFGKKPIRLAWFGFVLPALLINYFGQGALLIANPGANVSPFYHLAPDWARYPLVALATMATVIASQAVISGAFSLGRQAVQLGYSPRLNIVQTTSEERGQIYLPVINWSLFVAVVGLVLSFKSSSNLAAAYGMAVTSTMVITTMLMYIVARERWGWSRLSAGVVMSLFLIIDLAFFMANLVKVIAGGWFPLAIGATAALLMTTWRRGRQILASQLREKMIPFDDFLQQIKTDPPKRVSGCAVFLSGNPDGTPVALMHNLRHNRVLHKTVGILHIITENTPRVPSSERVDVKPLGKGVYHVSARYGFMEKPNIPIIMRQCAKQDVEFPPAETTFFLGRETLEISRQRTMMGWRKFLFMLMSRNAHDASRHFGVPPDRVVGIGVRLKI